MEKNRLEFSIDDFRLTIEKRFRQSTINNRQSAMQFSRGQSIVEYLVIAAVITVAVLGVGELLRPRVEEMTGASITAVEGATSQVDDKLKFTAR